MTTFVSREEWGAKPRRSGTTSINPTEGVTIHYEGGGWAWPWAHSTCAGKVRAMQADHMAPVSQGGRGWSDIAYNYLGCPHDYVFEGRGWDRRSSANGDEHSNYVSFAVQGIWGDKSGEPPDDLLRAIRYGIYLLRNKGRASSKLHGHRDWKSTSCPGDYLYAWVKKGCPSPDAVVIPPNEDGLTMALSQEALNQINEIVDRKVAAYANRDLRYMLQMQDEFANGRKIFEDAIKDGKTEAEADKAVVAYFQQFVEKLK